MRISDWSSDVCSSDLIDRAMLRGKLRHHGENSGADARQFGGCVDAVFPMNGPNKARCSSLRAQRSNPEIGRASCRERVCKYVSISVVAVSLKKKDKQLMHGIVRKYKIQTEEKI